ncbi:Uu.00g034230.m01.CDS01 [Anthostomella pinea]|uniref:Uu.00g034230.m01.CDS01 n=1 Tax=Anthostomella pinea TaxID=933095 RepID=A0AAI8V908_9PEZI|nr:Uu.00g034230.m01.CDS01 [Anthostomella pinea]
MLSFRGASGMATRRIRQVVIAPSRLSTTPRVNTLTCRRNLHVEGLMLAPVVFGGLFVGLWTWKCFMMVVFQNKIIYMPGLPPNSRLETIKDYADRCGGIQWREEITHAADGTDLALCVAEIDLGKTRDQAKPDASFYVLYFQGNAASIPPRLPDLSSALCMLKRHMSQETRHVRCTMVCLSYRGYWTSRGRPTENGIRLDAAAAVNWISQLYEKSCGVAAHGSRRPAKLILWGQSIGSGVATNLAAENSMPGNVRLDSLILETPFTSIRAMLEVLYPQKWLPYKYLWPFLRSQLDSWKNLGTLVEKQKSDNTSPEIFILQAAKDELVPAELSQGLYDRCIEVGLPTYLGDAMHVAATSQRIFPGSASRSPLESDIKKRDRNPPPTPTPFRPYLPPVLPERLLEIYPLRPVQSQLPLHTPGQRPHDLSKPPFRPPPQHMPQIPQLSRHARDGIIGNARLRHPAQGFGSLGPETGVSTLSETPQLAIPPRTSTCTSAICRSCGSRNCLLGTQTPVSGRYFAPCTPFLDRTVMVADASARSSWTFPRCAN